MAAARAAEAERRRAPRRPLRALRSRVPQRRRGPTGLLAQRRRRETGATIALLILVNLLVWLLTDGWAAPAMVLVVSLLAAPVLHTLLFRRR